MRPYPDTRSSTPTPSTRKTPAGGSPRGGRRGPVRRVRGAEAGRADPRPASGTQDPGLHAEAHRAVGQDTLFDLWRFHAFFTTSDPELLDTVAADKTHRGHAIIEQVHADLKNSALAHLPSGVFTANAAWLVLAVIAFNLTRAAGALAATDLAGRPPRPFAASWSTSHVGSRPRPDASPCTSRGTGPGKPPGRNCSPAPQTRPRPQPPDHPAILDGATTETQTPWQRGQALPHTIDDHGHLQPAESLNATPVGGSGLNLVPVNERDDRPGDAEVSGVRTDG